MLWSWHAFWSDLSDTGFLHAAWAALWIAAVAEVGGLFLGSGLALLGRSHLPPLRALAGIYIWCIRGTPLLIQLLIIYFGVPGLAAHIGVAGCGLLALVINEAAYLAVIAAACLNVIPSGNRDAGTMLGLTQWQRFRYVEAPQAIRLLIPLLGNQFNTMIKTTALLSIISYTELLQYADNTVNLTYRPTEAFATAALYYLAMTTLWTGAQALLERRLDISRRTRQRLIAALPQGAADDVIVAAFVPGGNRDDG